MVDRTKVLPIKQCHMCMCIHASVHCTNIICIQGAYQSTTGGKFGDAVSKFRELLLSITLLVVDNRTELTEVSASRFDLHVHVHVYVTESPLPTVKSVHRTRVTHPFRD